MTHIVTKCLRCNIVIHNFRTFFNLDFPLENIRKYKLQLIKEENKIKMMNQNYLNDSTFQENSIKIELLQNNKLDIFDCFGYFQKIEKLSGENAGNCNICKSISDPIFILYSKYFNSIIK